MVCHNFKAKLKPNSGSARLGAVGEDAAAAREQPVRALLHAVQEPRELVADGGAAAPLRQAQEGAAPVLAGVRLVARQPQPGRARQEHQVLRGRRLGAPQGE